LTAAGLYGATVTGLQHLIDFWLLLYDVHDIIQSLYDVHDDIIETFVNSKLHWMDCTSCLISCDTRKWIDVIRLLYVI
jgi:hypothetical protein